jgi:hypothetical protein
MGKAFNAGLPGIQLILKCAFWLSLLLLVISSWSMRYTYTPDLVAAGLAIPSLLIKGRAYKIMAIVVIGFALYEARYSEWLMNIEAPYN